MSEPFRPRRGEKYYYPQTDVPKLYGMSIWRDDEIDKRRLRFLMTFRTHEEAVEIAEKMLLVLRGGTHGSRSKNQTA